MNSLSRYLKGWQRRFAQPRSWRGENRFDHRVAGKVAICIYVKAELPTPRIVRGKVALTLVATGTVEIQRMISSPVGMRPVAVAR